MTGTPGADAEAAARCDEILARLLTLHPKVIDLSLDRVYALLAKLGHPERSLPPVVHVAGTNGKGSVIAVLRAILEAAGYRVHVHISPHLVHFNERIRLAGRLIPDTDLQALLTECENANAGEPITFFEITTAAAMLAFARSSADVLILETGLGGRLDATNVVDKPLVTVITPISMDHQQFLGNTIEAIAGEKAGIIKQGVPCVIGPQRPEAEAVLRADTVRGAAAAISAVAVAKCVRYSVRKCEAQLLATVLKHPRAEPAADARWLRAAIHAQLEGIYAPDPLWRVLLALRDDGRLTELPECFPNSERPLIAAAIAEEDRPSSAPARAAAYWWPM